MTTYPRPSDPVGSMTRADGSTVPHSRDHGRIIDIWENVKGHGAKGNGTAGNDAAAIQDAIDTVEDAGGGTVFFPLGTYILQEGITIPSDMSIKLVGIGQGGSILRTTANDSSLDMITFAGNTYQFTCQNMTLWSGENAGDIFVTGGFVAGSFFFDLYCLQSNPAKHIWYQNLTNDYLDNLWLSCMLEHAISSTESAFYIKDNAAAIGTSTFQRLRVVYSDGTKPFFHIEETGASTSGFDFVFRDINAEVCNGGFIEAYSQRNLVLENVSYYDLQAQHSGAIQNNMVKVATGSGGATVSQQPTFTNVNKRGAGTYDAGFYDINVTATGGFIARNCGATNGTFAGKANYSTGVIYNSTAASGWIEDDYCMYPASGPAGGMRLGRPNTSDLPTAAEAGAGAMLYDATRGKPLYSNGTNWKDFDGNNV